MVVVFKEVCKLFLEVVGGRDFVICVFVIVIDVDFYGRI